MYFTQVYGNSVTRSTLQLDKIWIATNPTENERLFESPEIIAHLYRSASNILKSTNTLWVI